VVSVDVGGPQESSEGREEIMSESDMGAMIAMSSALSNVQIYEVFDNISLVGNCNFGGV
jgi:hypothetical protein